MSKAYWKKTTTLQSHPFLEDYSLGKLGRRAWTEERKEKGEGTFYSQNANTPWTPYSHNTGEFEQLRRRRQRERQKNLRFIFSKTTTLQVHRALLYISLPWLHAYNVKVPNFVEDGNTREQLSLTFPVNFNTVLYRFV